MTKKYVCLYSVDEARYRPPSYKWIEQLCKIVTRQNIDKSILANHVRKNEHHCPPRVKVTLIDYVHH